MKRFPCWNQALSAGLNLNFFETNKFFEFDTNLMTEKYLQTVPTKFCQPRGTFEPPTDGPPLELVVNMSEGGLKPLS